MKTLKKLEINPERLMKNEELITLRGGYDGEMGYCGCRGNNDETLCTMWVECYRCGSECFSRCPGATSSVCVG